MFSKHIRVPLAFPSAEKPAICGGGYRGQFQQFPVYIRFVFPAVQDQFADLAFFPGMQLGHPYYGRPPWMR